MKAEATASDAKAPTSDETQPPEASDAGKLAQEQFPSQEETVRIIGPTLAEKGGTFRKTKGAFLKKAEAGEKVITVFGDKVETENVAGEHDWIVRADTSAKERYVIDSAKVENNYSLTPEAEAPQGPEAEELAKEGFKHYSSSRRILALEVDDDILSRFPAGKFIASWGEPMLVELGDYLCSGLPDEGGKIGEIYRIEKEAFFETYTKVDL